MFAVLSRTLVSEPLNARAPAREQLPEQINQHPRIYRALSRLENRTVERDGELSKNLERSLLRPPDRGTLHYFSSTFFSSSPRSSANLPGAGWLAGATQVSPGYRTVRIPRTRPELLTTSWKFIPRGFSMTILFSRVCDR